MKWCLWLVVLITVGCQYKYKEPLAARVGNHYLTVAELRDQIPDNLDPEDSLTLAENFIDRWVKNKLNLAKAQELLERSDLDVEDLLEDYRESLILHYFEEKVAGKLVDSVVSNATIDDYYERNSHEFILEEDLYEVWVLKTIPMSKKEVSDLKKEIDKADELIDIPLSDSTTIESRWLSSFDLERLFDIRDISSTFDAENEVEVITSPKQYIFLKYIGKKNKGDVAPLDFVKNKIMEIVLEERKIQAISEVKNQIYQDALTNNRFKIFQHD